MLDLVGNPKDRFSHYETQFLVSDTTCPDDYYTTIEEQELFSQCYPQIVDEFNVTQEEKKAKKSSKGILNTYKKNNKRIIGPRSDKRDLMAIKVKSEIFTEKEGPSYCE